MVATDICVVPLEKIKQRPAKGRSTNETSEIDIQEGWNTYALAETS
jgi:hypothetical protein